MDKKEVTIVYFSGTGGTKKIVDVMYKQLANINYSVTRHSLDHFNSDGYIKRYIKDIKNCGLLFVVYPVYVFDAPDIIYDWAKCLPSSMKVDTVVISVSGGGEVWPNISCRIGCIRELEKKGFNVFYENMMVMPSNCIIKTNDHLSKRLLDAIPNKVDSILKDITLGKKKRYGYRFGIYLSLFLSKLEKRYQSLFSQSLKVKENCLECGWCVNSCPRNNIIIGEGKPYFGENCIMCLRCIYRCPNRSVYTDKYNWMIFKEGYNLNNIEEKMKGVKLQAIEKCCKGLLWMGVKKYLKIYSVDDK